MKKKLSIKTVIIVVILLLVGVLGVLGINTARTYLSGASGANEPKNVLAKANEDGKSAVVTWASDKATVGVVEYGTTPASLLLRAPESEQATTHSVTLMPLKSGTNYYFRIRIGEEVFDNNGIPYSFKTKMVEAPTPTITVMPTVNLVPTVSEGTACNRTVDYNKDKVVNSLDYMYCLKNKPSGGAVPTVSTGGCAVGVDYDKNGVVNSLDRIKCLQNKN